MQDKNSTKVKIILDLLAANANVKGIKGLAEFLEEPSSRLYGWIRNGKIFDTKSILTKFPNINEEWLKSGEGPTFKYQPPPGGEINFDFKSQNPPTEQPASLTTEESFDMPDMVKMTMEILASDTVHKSALVSNIRAFHKAVNMEKEMQSVKEKLEKMEMQSQEMVERMTRMEEMLLSFGASLPEKRDKKAM